MDKTIKKLLEELKDVDLEMETDVNNPLSVPELGSDISDFIEELTISQEELFDAEDNFDPIVKNILEQSEKFCNICRRFLKDSEALDNFDFTKE